MNEPAADGILRGKIHILPVRIYYEDTDLSGIVYHANYLRYLERGRSDFLWLIGIRHSDLLVGDNPIAWAVTRMELDFLKPARIEDRLEVHTAYTGVSGARLFADQSITRGDDELVRAKLQAVCMRPDGRPVRLPASIRALLNEFLTAF